MKIRLRQPLALFSFLALILLTGLSVVSSVLEVRLTNRLDGDAAAINLSGTLRMQSYQLAYAIEKKTPLFERQSLVRDFETRLNAPTLAGQIATAPSALQSQFDLVQHRFQIMKAAALN
ncbi:MAG: type IV pili methyl-accepting chemotaxis transducer N-terminal domain-containing protein, partial [Reinekea forsetii]|nr:type IV pili methyl-accepting chemotaxis transducer N-terminal domain-containing protein [Reinekea forsetii]